jgi:CheY-like chemotaxis protein
MEYGKRVMIVDDDEEIRSVLLHVMASYDFEVKLCDNGTEALLSLMSTEFDYIVTDDEMPGMDGLELTRRLRKQIPPLTVLIGMSSMDRSRDFLTAGANDFLQKPFFAYKLAMMMDGGDILS